MFVDVPRLVAAAVSFVIAVDVLIVFAIMLARRDADTEKIAPVEVDCRDRGPGNRSSS